MFDDRDIVGAAQLLIVRHGRNASIWAARQADEEMAREDIVGAGMWRAIGRTIEELRRERRADESFN